MRLLFVHDHIFSSSKCGEVYSAAAYPTYAWARYFEFFDEVAVVGRYSGVAEKPEDTLVRSSREGVVFEFVDSIANPASLFLRSKGVRQRIYELVASSNAVVARLPSENGLLACACAKELGKPCAVEVVGCVWDALWNHGSWLAKLYAPIAFWRMRQAVKHSKRTLYVTQSFLQRRYPSAKNALTVSASNVEIESPCMSKIESRDWSKPKLVLGLIGNYKTRYKGIHLAIEALSLLKNDLGDFELRVLGKGDPVEYREMAKRMGVLDNTVFCGALPNGEPVMRWLDEIDLYMQPSLTEGLPRALIEAMSRGCVCVGSDAGGTPELLPLKLVHRAGDARSLAEVVKTALSEKGCWSSISLQNYERSKVYDKSFLNKKRSDFYFALKKAATQ